MISVSANWISNQKKQLRSESDVRLTFYTRAIPVVQKAILTKKDIASFNYEEKGSIINEVIPYTTITFELIKSTGQSLGFNKTDLVKIEYGYDINGTWEWIEKGVYQIDEIKISRNDFRASYVLKTIFYDILNNQCPVGSQHFDNTELSDWTFAKLFDYTLKSLIENSAYTCGTGITYGSCVRHTNTTTFDNDQFPAPFASPQTFGELLQLMAQATGSTLFFKGSIVSGTPRLDVYFNDLHLIYSTDYLIDENLCKEFPEIEESSPIRELTYNTYTNTNNFYNLPYTEIDKEYSILGQESLYIEAPQGVVKYVYSTDITGSITFTSFGTKIKMTGNTAGQNTSTGHFKCIDENNNKYPKSLTISASGKEDMSFDNKMISVNQQTEFENFMSYWLPKNQFISMEYRVDPRIELFDLIHYKDDLYDDYCFVEEISYSFNGGFNGKIKTRITELPTLFNASFENYTGVELYSADVIENETPVYVGATPTRVKDGYYRYYFTGWSPALAPITADTTYTAQFGKISLFDIIEPVVLNQTWNEQGKFSFRVYNNNSITTKATFYIGSTKLPFTTTISGNTYITLNQNNLPELANYFDLWNTGDLNQNIFVQFEENATPQYLNPSDKAVIIGCIRPIVENLYYDEDKFSFDLTNPSANRPCVINIETSSGDTLTSVNLSAGQTIHIDSDNPAEYDEIVDLLSIAFYDITHGYNNFASIGLIDDNDLVSPFTALIREEE